jgi:hypothetical protein
MSWVAALAPSARTDVAIVGAAVNSASAATLEDRVRRQKRPVDLGDTAGAAHEFVLTLEYSKTNGTTKPHPSFNH